ncbi:MAG: hypothetical protein Q9227_000037 [Pyrenula ochraceoflavens]
MPFLNPFGKYDITDFPDVYVPLAEAPRNASVVAENRRRYRASISASSDDKNEKGEKDVDLHSITGPLTVDSLKAEIETDVAASGHDSAYDRKSKVINKAIQDIGMGSYQWQLFVLCGFGWLADNLWLQGVALTLTPMGMEFGVSETNVRYTTLSVFTGLCIGAVGWGTASDIIGRRLAFNTTLFLAGVFGIAVGGGNSWIAVCGLYASLGVGVGGNLPVDGALFLEFLPFASGNLLTMLSVWWPIGQLLGSLIAWGFIPNYSCSEASTCTKANNMGWRYLNFTMGAFTFFMFVCRFFFFHLFESPKFLLSKGRQREAVGVVYGIAHRNGAKTWLTEEILNEIGGRPEDVSNMKLSAKEVLLRQAEKFSTQRIAPLFNGWKLGVTTVLIWFCWATIGMAYPLYNAFLPQYIRNVAPDQAPEPTSVVYRNYAITSIVGVPGSIIACYTVNIKYFGRKGTIALATMLTGIFVFLFTTSTDSDTQLAFTCLEAFFQNIMYGVLYAYTPEVFPAPNRGTGTGIASFFNRVAGLCAPIVAIKGSTATPKAPIYASGGLFFAAMVAMLLFPIETRGRQSL